MCWLYTSTPFFVFDLIKRKKGHQFCGAEMTVHKLKVRISVDHGGGWYIINMGDNSAHNVTRLETLLSSLDINAAAGRWKQFKEDEKSFKMWKQNRILKICVAFHNRRYFFGCCSTKHDDYASQRWLCCKYNSVLSFEPIPRNVNGLFEELY